MSACRIGHADGFPAHPMQPKGPLMLRSDCHLHSCYSTDSETPPALQAEAAYRAGLKEICFTDHCDPGFPGGEFQLDFDACFHAVSALQETWGNKLKIRAGLELGLRPEPAFRAEILEASEKEPFSFIIGSTHLVDGADTYLPEAWEGKDARAIVRRYYEQTLENIRLFDCFDSYGHLDYISRTIPDFTGYVYRFEDYADIVDEILKELIARGKALECNTAGYRYAMKQPNPGEVILRRYRELGGELLTTGSDAHCPGHVALGFEEAYALLRRCGFRYIAVFDNRRPLLRPIDD